MKTNETKTGAVKVTGEMFATGPAGKHPTYTGMTQEQWDNIPCEVHPMTQEECDELERMLGE